MSTLTLQKLGVKITPGSGAKCLLPWRVAQYEHHFHSVGFTKAFFYY